MKTSFELEELGGDKNRRNGGQINIIGRVPEDVPYVSITVYCQNSHRGLFVRDVDLRRLAKNILKALGE